jgi:hypothetical protein
MKSACWQEVSPRFCDIRQRARGDRVILASALGNHRRHLPQLPRHPRPSELALRALSVERSVQRLSVKHVPHHPRTIAARGTSSNHDPFAGDGEVSRTPRQGAIRLLPPGRIQPHSEAPLSLTTISVGRKMPGQRHDRVTSGSAALFAKHSTTATPRGRATSSRGAPAVRWSIRECDGRL